MILAVSPHLDDAVFSIGAWLAACDDEVVVATVFTASVARPHGFALACQTDKGIAPEVDYMALRRAEDGRACAMIGARAVHLGLLEAPHRGYGSAEALFGGVRAGDDPPIAGVLAPLLAEADVVLAPAAIGGHVDHLLVRAAVRPDREWVDLPYALRAGRRPDAPLPAPEALARKLDACACYATQLGFQFGGEAAMREALGGWPEAFTR